MVNPSIPNEQAPEGLAELLPAEYFDKPYLFLIASAFWQDRELKSLRAASAAAAEVMTAPQLFELGQDLADEYSSNDGYGEFYWDSATPLYIEPNGLVMASLGHVYQVRSFLRDGANDDYAEDSQECLSDAVESAIYTAYYRLNNDAQEADYYYGFFARELDARNSDADVTVI